MILQRITAVGTDGSRVMLHLDDGSRLRVSATLVADKGLYQGMDLSDGDLQELMDLSRRASAKSRAVRIVSAAAVSERELKRRLLRRGERTEDAQEAVDWLRDLGALDDEAMAGQIVRRCIEKGYGRERIRQELYQKGIPRRFWDEALEDLPDMGPAIDRFLERRLRGELPERKELSRIIAALQRRGHSWEDIRAALNRYGGGEMDPDSYE